MCQIRFPETEKFTQDINCFFDFMLDLTSSFGNNFTKNRTLLRKATERKADIRENESWSWRWREDWGERAEETVEKESKRKDDGDGEVEREEKSYGRYYLLQGVT